MKASVDSWVRVVSWKGLASWEVRKSSREVSEEGRARAVVRCRGPMEAEEEGGGVQDSCLFHGSNFICVLLYLCTSACIAHVERRVCAQHRSEFHANVFLVRYQVFLNRKM